jgi:hypothetical protein
MREDLPGHLREVQSTAFCGSRCHSGVACECSLFICRSDRRTRVFRPGPEGSGRKGHGDNRAQGGQAGL